MAHRLDGSRPTRRWLSVSLVMFVAGVFGSIRSEAYGQGTAPPPQAAMINELIAKVWKENEIKPAEIASDYVFIRRVFLDILGRIPTAEEVRDFERDKSANRRSKLIHRLLYADSYKLKDAQGKDLLDDQKKPIVFSYTQEYAERWADIWTIWLMTRGGVHDMYHANLRFWIAQQISKNTPYDEMVRQLLTATGKTSENGAVAFMMAHLGEPVGVPRDKNMTQVHKEDGKFDMVPLTSRITRLFLGIQTQCAQCHDHPFYEQLGQEHFWGMNAFLRQIDRDRTPAMKATGKQKKGMEALPVTLTDNPELNSIGPVYYEKRNALVVSISPTFLPNLADFDKEKNERPKKIMPKSTSKTRREILADFMISHDNFAKAYVNRIWAHLFGRGMNELPAFDDFGGHNKVVHAELLEKLGEEFIKYKYDSRALLEWICNSQVYQLSYVAPNKEMTDQDKEPFFGRMPLKALSPESLFEALMTATKGYAAADKEARKSMREQWMNKLVRQYGDDEGNELTYNGTIVQALLMMNGNELNNEIRRKDGTVAKAIDRALASRVGTLLDKEQMIIDELYLSALSRRPSKTTMVEVELPSPNLKSPKRVTKMSEYDFVRSQLATIRPKPTDKKAMEEFLKDPKKAYQAFFEDLFWTLLNTNEFILNH